MNKKTLLLFANDSSLLRSSCLSGAYNAVYVVSLRSPKLPFGLLRNFAIHYMKKLFVFKEEI